MIYYAATVGGGIIVEKQTCSDTYVKVNLTKVLRKFQTMKL